ncbi:unnamed protein product, partial [marine sediment metagenome]
MQSQFPEGRVRAKFVAHNCKKLAPEAVHFVETKVCLSEFLDARIQVIGEALEVSYHIVEGIGELFYLVPCANTSTSVQVSTSDPLGYIPQLFNRFYDDHPDEKIEDDESEGHGENPG